MTQHFTRSTVSASFHCPKCKKKTQHRIDHGVKGAGRKGPCLECIERLERECQTRKLHAVVEIQEGLFR